MKRIIILILILFPVFASAQVYVTQDNANQFRKFNGKGEFMLGFRLPVQGGHSIPATDSLWFMRVNPGDGQVYMWNGLTWGCVSCGGGGSTDSSLFVTITRLSDSLLAVYSTINDTANAIRGDIPDVSGFMQYIDTAGMLSAYTRVQRFLDSISAIQSRINGKVGYTDTAAMLGNYTRLQRFIDSTVALRSAINAKQNQLNGTGFVKVSGTTISYDNSTYTPTSRTISINGTTQDLSANRTWAIPVIDTSSLSDRINTKIDSIRTSVDSIFVKYAGTWYFAGIISAQGAGVSWGSIGGALSDQTDLMSALNGKLGIGDSVTLYITPSRLLDSLSGHWAAIEGKLDNDDPRIANWTAAYNDKINSAAFTGTTTKTLTLTQQDGGTVTANFTDANTTYIGSTSITLSGTSFQRAALTGDVTAPANSNATTIANSAVTNAKMANMSASTIKGREGTTGAPQDLTATQVRTIINVADGAEVNVQSDWDAVSGDAMILNKPTIPDISGLATQEALNDTSEWTRDSITALRAAIGSSGGSVDTTSLSNRINQKVTKGGEPSGDLTIGIIGSGTINFITQNTNRFRVRSNYVSSILPMTVGNDGPMTAGYTFQTAGNARIQGSSSAVGLALSVNNSASTSLFDVTNTGDVLLYKRNYRAASDSILARSGDTITTVAVSSLTKVSFNTQTGTTYTLTQSDFNGRTIVVCTNANPITVTVPAGLEIGTNVLVKQGGAGAITFVGGSGVTMQSKDSALSTGADQSHVTIYVEDTDLITLTGDLQ